jgi:hypothetical protein
MKLRLKKIFPFMQRKVGKEISKFDFIVTERK